MMDGDQLREELRKLIAQEVQQQFSAYRGAVSAELTFMDQELDDGLRAVQDKFASAATEILESHALRVTRGIERAQGIVGTWGRALLFGAFLFAGIGAAAQTRDRLDRTAISVAGGEERRDRRTDRRAGAHPGLAPPPQRRTDADRTRQRRSLLRAFPRRCGCVHRLAREESASR